MGETIDYGIWIKFKKEADAKAFAEKLREKGQTLVSDPDKINVDGDTVEVSQPDGWRGGGAGCEDIIRQQIGDLLKEFKDRIIDFEATAFHVEQAPEDSFGLEDIIEEEDGE